MKRFMIRLFTKIICPQMHIKFQDDSNFYDADEMAIYLDLHDINDCGFLRHLHEIHECRFTYDLSLLMWTILHELGHHFIEDEIEDDEDDLFTREICALIDKEDAVTPEIQNIYFNLDTEFEATEWAITFVKTHPYFCLLFNTFIK